MSSPAEVSLLKQQVSTLRSGSQALSPKQARRLGVDGEPFKIAVLGPVQAGKTKIAAQVRQSLKRKRQ